MKGYNKIPKHIGVFPCEVKEYFSYTYLPIKLAGQSELTIERRLQIFDKIIGRAACDFIGDYSLDRFVDSYVYLTAKHQYQKLGAGFNRPGWHSDGFLTNDISYIWYDKQPTIFNNSDFDLTQDDKLSMVEMEKQARPENNFEYQNNSLIRMDQFSIHKVAEYEEGNRAFVKICFSYDKYALEGNSINYELDYKWDYYPRLKTRNIPQNENN